MNFVNCNIVAIVVTFNPDFDQLKKTIDGIIKQVAYCIIVDNGNTVFPFQYNNLIIISLGCNQGIAYAQNKGIKYAFLLGASYILFSDQDTEYPEDFIKNIFSVYNSLLPKYKNNVALLAPVFYDIRKKAKSFIMLTKFSYTNNHSLPYIHTAQAISSGSFVAVEALKKIGLMNERLFIDYVDFEWCWRATGLGYKIFTVPQIVIKHSLGHDTKIICGKTVTIRNNMRYFYMIRNAFFLSLHSPYLKFHEKILLAKRAIIHSVGVIVLEHNIQSIKLVGLALFEGSTGFMNNLRS
jgi:rhamnosyltransferase